MRRVVVLFLALLTLAPAAAATFPQTWPDDPAFAAAENDASCRTSVLSEQHYLYSFLPRCAPNARDPEGAAGMSVDAAWAQYTPGEPEVVIAYVEGGINWHADSARDLVNQVWLNRAELPLPIDPRDVAVCEGGYDANCDGVLNVRDYGLDPRAKDANGNGYLDPEDLIVAFSDGLDQDGNGFVDDISGWDFYDHQNDPATVDSTYDHANGQMRQAAAEADNGLMGAGVCPGCRLLPIKAGAEALDRPDDLAQAWLYADRMGAAVVVSVTADLGYASVMAQTVEKLWSDGVVMVEASNDFDSTDHQGGMWWPHVLPGNGLVANNQQELQQTGLDNAGVTTFRARSDETSWGAHNVLSVATNGGSTSTSTPTVGGVVGLVLSEGVKAYREGKLARPLTGPQAVQILIASASDINDPTLAWPGKPGWDLQYGYGRPNVLRAMQMVEAAEIPPVPTVFAPTWFTLYDPTRDAAIPLDFAVNGTPGTSWTLEWGLGAEPAAWTTLATGAAPGRYQASLPTGAIPESFWRAPFRMSSTKALESSEQYTVTFRLRATDGAGLAGEDRRAVAVHHDDAWAPGFPLRVGGQPVFAGGAESQPALADLNADGRLDIVFADGDGRVHALDASCACELAGWPALTDPTVFDVPVAGIDPGHEPVIAPVAVGDLRHDGTQQVVVASATGRVYVFEADGTPVAGWPRALDRFAQAPPIPRPALPFTRLPHLGATASPVLVDLDGDEALEIVQAAWDGGVYAFRADGSDLAGWPLQATLPASVKLQPGHKLVNDSKVVTTPAVADLDGDGRPELVVQSQLTEVLDDGIQPLAVSHVLAYHADGTPVAGWPATLPTTVEYYGSAQEFITEGSTAPAAADVDHDGRDEVAVSPVFGPTYLLDGAGRIRAVYGPVPGPLADALALILPLDAASNLPADAPVTFTTSGAFGRLGGTLTYAQAGSGGASVASGLLLTGSGQAIQNHERAYDAATGAPRPGFPTELQGLNFLGAPLVADLDGDGLADVVDGGDSSAMHAFTALGTPVAGFPKFTTGWTLFSPAAGDLGDGTTSLVATTREGYVMVWRTEGRPTAEWWSYHHDERRTGRYGADTLPPGPLGEARLEGATLRFVAPGGDAMHGRVAGYVVHAAGRAWVMPAHAEAGQAETLRLPAAATGLVRVQAVDAAGNLGPATRVEVPPAPGFAWLSPILLLLPGVALVIGARRLR